MNAVRYSKLERFGRKISLAACVCITSSVFAGCVLESTYEVANLNKRFGFGNTPTLTIVDATDSIAGSVNLAENTAGVPVLIEGKDGLKYTLTCASNCSVVSGSTGTLPLSVDSAPRIRATLTGAVAVEATQTDTAGAVSLTGTASTTADLTPPTVTIGLPNANDANSGSTITFTVTYEEATTYSLLDTGVTLNTTGGASCSKGVTNGTTSAPTVTLTNCTGNGTVGISIAANTAQDAAGNGNAASAASATFNVDNTAPIFTSLALANGTADNLITATDVTANLGGVGTAL
jgi:hypothetical protein